jgi:tetratricopeptide (TPR) repeat protein
LVLVCEDLHWADPSSIELLDQMLGLTDRVGLLFICVFRPCRECGCWRLREVAARDYPHRHTDVWLQALSSADSEILVRNLLRIEGIPKPFRPKILSVAEGNPFYVEEILRGLIDQGAVIADQATGCWMVTAAAAEVELPSTLQAALVARIDRLQEDTRRVLQIASVIGRSFRYRVLEDIAREQRELDAHLLALQREEMIRERARIPELEYVFKHELTREAAYAGLLKKERRTLHRQVAQALERLFPERIERQLGLLAYHWEQAAVPQKAAQYLQRAGDQARLAYANEEAIGYYQRALPVLEACAAEGLPAEWTLDVAGQVDEGLGDVLDWTGQYDRARSAYQHALAQAPSDRPIGRARLHRKIGDTCRRQRRYKEALQAYDLAQTELDTEPVEHTQEWWREWVQVRIERVWTHYWLAEWHEIGRLVEKLQPDVEQHGTPRQRCWFFSALALMAFRRDRYVVSEETLRHSQAAEAASQELGDLAMMTNAQFELGFAQLWLGDLDKAEQNLQASLTLAERTGDVMLEARCLTYLTVASRKRGQVEKTRHYIAKSLEVATAVQMREYIATAKANRAWVSWREENLAEAQENGRTALELWQQMPLVYPFRWTALWPLIGVALAENRTADAVEHARSLLEVTQQRLPDRLTGQLEEAISAWEGGEPQRAHACLNQCIEVAQEMGDL